MGFHNPAVYMHVHVVHAHNMQNVHVYAQMYVRTHTCTVLLIDRYYTQTTKAQTHYIYMYVYTAMIVNSINKLIIFILDKTCPRYYTVEPLYYRHPRHHMKCLD